MESVLAADIKVKKPITIWMLECEGDMWDSFITENVRAFRSPYDAMAHANKLTDEKYGRFYYIQWRHFSDTSINMVGKLINPVLGASINPHVGSGKKALITWHISRYIVAPRSHRVKNRPLVI